MCPHKQPLTYKSRGASFITGKVVNDMDKVEYETLINEIYDGKVKAKDQYINPNAVLFHKCLKCNERFYGKPSFMVGSDSQRHLCGFPYGDQYGVRLTNVPKRGDGANKKKKTSEKTQKEIIQLAKQGLNNREISHKLHIAIQAVSYYVKKAGLTNGGTILHRNRFEIIE